MHREPVCLQISRTSIHSGTGQNQVKDETYNVHICLLNVNGKVNLVNQRLLIFGI